MNSFGFKKEWLMFLRTKRFLGVILAIVLVAFSYPFMLKFLEAMIDMLGEMEAAGQISADEFAAFGSMYGMLDSASTAFGAAMLSVVDTSLLVICLLLMNACGGEQKKRSTIIPNCSGLTNMQYLLPKFVLYPSVLIVITFITGIITGFMCNAMFVPDQVDINGMLLTSALAAVYLAFMVCVFMTLGICTARPGISVAITYLGQTLIIYLLQALGFNRFNPFTLYIMVGSGALTNPRFPIEEETASIVTAVVLSVVIAVMLFFLTYCVLGAKKINNRDDKPQF